MCVCITRVLRQLLYRGTNAWHSAMYMYNFICVVKVIRWLPYIATSYTSICTHTWHQTCTQREHSRDNWQIGCTMNRHFVYKTVGFVTPMDFHIRNVQIHPVGLVGGALTWAPGAFMCVKISMHTHGMTNLITNNDIIKPQYQPPYSILHNLQVHTTCGSQCVTLTIATHSVSSHNFILSLSHTHRHQTDNLEAMLQSTLPNTQTKTHMLCI